MDESYSKQVANALKINTTITSIKFGHYPSTSLQFQEMIELLTSVTSDRPCMSIYINMPPLSPNGMRLIAEALATNSTVTKIDISDRFDALEMSHLIEVVQRSTTLTTFTTMGTFLNCATIQEMEHASDSGSKNQKLRPSQPMDVLANALTHNQSLTTISFQYFTDDLDPSKEDTSTEMIRSLARVLCINSTLTCVLLDNNHFTDDGMDDLAHALSINTTVAFIDLSLNSIGDAGISELAGAVKSSLSLTRLYLAFNKCGREAEIKLAEAVNVNRRLLFVSTEVNFQTEQPSEQMIRLERLMKRIFKRNQGVALLDRMHLSYSYCDYHS